VRTLHATTLLEMACSRT